MPLKLANSAQAALSTGGSDLSIGSVNFAVVAGFGERFPVLGSDDFTYVRFGTNELHEIVKVTARTADAFTCAATTMAWANGTDIQIVQSKEVFEEYLQKVMGNYSEKVQSAVIASGVLTIDLSLGNCFEVELTENVTSFDIQNAKATGFHHPFTLYVKQDSTGSRTVDFAGMHTSGGSAPTITSDASAKDAFTIATRDGGTTWEVSQFGTDVQVIS